MPMAPHAYYSPRLSPEDNTCTAFQFVDGLSIRPINELGAALDALVEAFSRNGRRALSSTWLWTFTAEMRAC